MKEYTTPQQTAKLIELGFEKPKGISKCNVGTGTWGYRPLCEPTYAYSIGELIEMLPKGIKGSSLQMYHAVLWSVSYPMLKDKYYVSAFELCDALFEMVCYLKEQEII